MGLLSEINRGTTIAFTFTATCAIVNVRGVPKNHPLMLLADFTRLIINKAHFNNLKTHPNTFLYKILHMSDIFCANDAKYKDKWGEISERCRQLLTLFNPQIFPRKLARIEPSPAL